jgi:hypothetical protein
MFYAQSNGVTGKWKTVDETGQAKSIVEIYENQENLR